ncbi:hypothetical protein LguiB_009395 [Lonicera macranthoides]
MKVSAFSQANTTKKMMNSEQENDSDDLAFLSRIDLLFCQDSRGLAAKGIYAAVDPLDSTSTMLQSRIVG